MSMSNLNLGAAKLHTLVRGPQAQRRANFWT
jgi:hypothetical protein